MTENELFAKAWLFLYQAAGQNIGFTVERKTTQTPEEKASA